MDRATFTTSGITSKNKQQKYVPVGNYPEGSLVVRERPVHHSGLRFTFPRSYNLPPSSLITRSICLYNGAALVTSQQEWPSKDRTISIT